MIRNGGKVTPGIMIYETPRKEDQNMIIGYARVSTVEQNEARQIDALNEYGVDKIYLDKLSGKNTERHQLNAMMDYVREGDTVIVTEFSRFSRSTKDLLSLVEQLTKKKVEFKSLKENVDTTTPQGKLVLTLFAALSEFEREIILERQAEGIAAAKKAGKPLGRKPVKIDQKKLANRIELIKEGKLSRTGVAKEFRISRVTLNKLIKQYEDSLSSSNS